MEAGEGWHRISSGVSLELQANVELKVSTEPLGSEVYLLKAAHLGFLTESSQVRENRRTLQVPNFEPA